MQPRTAPPSPTGTAYSQSIAYPAKQRYGLSRNGTAAPPRYFCRRNTEMLDPLTYDEVKGLLRTIYDACPATHRAQLTSRFDPAKYHSAFKDDSNSLLNRSRKPGTRSLHQSKN